MQQDKDYGILLPIFKCYLQIEHSISNVKHGSTVQNKWELCQFSQQGSTQLKLNQNYISVIYILLGSFSERPCFMVIFKMDDRT